MSLQINNYLKGGVSESALDDLKSFGKDPLEGLGERVNQALKDDTDAVDNIGSMCNYFDPRDIVNNIAGITNQIMPGMTYNSLA